MHLLPRRGRPHAAAALVYVLAAALMGRDVLGGLGSGVANDAGDPLLTAAILYWNATRVPLTEAWWQFPSFAPTRDTMAFSEHLLGLSAVAAPLQWITGDPLVAYNVTVLLTFPLCALSMYVLVYRLTGSAAGAFIGGLAYGFAPYRVSQLPHVQMLAGFWAPLALVGLHAFVETGRRRWLALFGAGWLLQSAASGYALVFFTVVVGLWVLWFVVRGRQWRSLSAIVLTMAGAGLPLAPILLKYVEVHARHGFARDLDEMRFFSADIGAVLCAPEGLTFWGWLRVACRAEGELFPGLVVPLLVAVGGLRLAIPSARDGGRRALLAITGARVLLAFAVFNVLMAALVAAGEPVRFAIGPVRVSASSIANPLVLAGLAFSGAVLLARRRRGATAGARVPGFFLLCAAVTWVLALGPTPALLGEPRELSGPFAWLMALPGVEGLRVPARFWLFTTLCLAVLAGLVTAETLAKSSSRLARAAWLLLAAGVLADGWTRVRLAPLPEPVPDARLLSGRTVLWLPAGDVRDVVPQFHAATGGWRSVNGYSGYQPSYYVAVAEAVRSENPKLFRPFRALGDLDVIVPRDAPRLESFVAVQPGARLLSRSERLAHYRLPAGEPPAPLPRTAGARVPIRGVMASCWTAAAPRMTDGHEKTRWDCGAPQQGDEEVRIDLGAIATVGAVVNGLGPYASNFPRHLVVETSLEGAVWEPAWDGDVLDLVFAAAFAAPAQARLVVPFAPRAARFVRLRQTGRDPSYYWSITELEIWSAATR